MNDRDKKIAGLTRQMARDMKLYNDLVWRSLLAIQSLLKIEDDPEGQKAQQVVDQAAELRSMQLQMAKRDEEQ